jgi:hypothetical protein
VSFVSDSMVTNETSAYALLGPSAVINTLAVERRSALLLTMAVS